jgi:hypothetical protein
VNRPLVNNQENRAEVNVTLIFPGQQPANGSTMVIPDPIGLCANPVINNQQVIPKPPPQSGTKEHYVVATIWMTGDEVKNLSGSCLCSLAKSHHVIALYFSVFVLQFRLGDRGCFYSSTNLLA